MKNYKKINETTYDLIARNFEKQTSNYLFNYILSDAEKFLKFLPGKKILDLGSGPGRDSLFFRQRGFDSLCLDISPEMIQLCKEKGLKAMVGDLENLSFKEKSFHGVWAYTSLVHVPKKNLRNVLTDIKNILKQDGLLYLGMKEGDFEGFKKNRGNLERFFSFYTDEELRNILKENFEIMNFSNVNLEHDFYLNYLAKKK